MIELTDPNSLSLNLNFERLKERSSQLLDLAKELVSNYSFN